MLTEIYHQELIDTDQTELQTAFDQWERRAQLTEALGLAGQHHYMKALERAKEIPFKLLTPEEIRVWQRYLQKQYLDTATLLLELEHRSFRDRDRLDRYAHDLIPLNVLEAWLHCRQLGYFESYEIWSSEEQPDPILIGRVGPLSFLIARWGESLKPFEEIRQEVQRPRR